MTIEDRKLAADLDAAFALVNVADPPPPPAQESVAKRRSRRGAPPPPAAATLKLVRVDGILRWTYRRPARQVGRRRAARAGLGPVGGTVVRSFDFREIPPNQVVAKLEQLDAKLTPNRGLRQWNGTSLVPATPVSARRLLLFIHGTFSKSDLFFEELRATPEGQAFLARAAQEYKAILAFDHPTVSVSPILNAFDLEVALAGFKGKIDVVCHSRGGLVASWWLRLGPRNVDKVVFVASPLEGTSLASPPRLKHTLDRLANIADGIEKAASVGSTFVPPAAPLLGLAAGLMQVLGGVLSVGAKTPLLDVGVAAIAGLNGQSAVGNNPELLRLHAGTWMSSPRCYAVTSDFEPGDPAAPWWKFWTSWRHPALKLGDMFADPVFDGPNDLVVDSGSMTRLLNNTFPAGDVLDYQTNSVVHHCNYFAQPQTVGFLHRTLGVA